MVSTDGDAGAAMALEPMHLSGTGHFTRRCQELIEQQLGSGSVLLPHSCTAALEMAAILAGIGPGDEVIRPPFASISTADAVVLRGGVPVFINNRPHTLSLDSGRGRHHAAYTRHLCGALCRGG